MKKTKKRRSTNSSDMIEEIKASISPAREKLLRKIIKRLSDSEDHAFRPRHGRLDFYAYLEKVLKVYWDWEDKKARKTRGEQLGALVGLPPRKGRTSLHVLIEASSKQKREIKSRWVRALEFASKYRPVVEKDGLKELVRANGGIAGCAEKIAESAKTNKRGKIAKVAKTTTVAPAVRPKKSSGDEDDDWDE